ncbi:carboxymuconolactone decarboxylase family protein [Mesorhizobium sp. L-8-3]|uniref:carboxymuconolactone decarboxylase family protein n=1 Tax=Mesorhizobium sp. L-8-3 TaxID=2744522 RepID=UPI00192731DE|nr:carboxymuconolactone decarboxylase family protein [Mesorhizobium sp. L-8-3]BCH23312.1 alkyl hydroperoxide reductase AhpD [Mesorhizobium sp. L-8-3]
MGPRLNPYDEAPDAMKAMLSLDGFVRKRGIDEQLYWLVKIRASQINGCAYCIHMHTREGRAAGISEDRMHLLPAWRESPLYSAKERAALAWTESLTLLPETGAPDDVFEALRAEFGPKEIVDLTLLIGTINVWNRIAVGFRSLHPVSTDTSNR